MVNIASQPVSSGGQFSNVSGGVGTTVVTAAPATLERVIVPGTYVGTLRIHDSATAAGTTSTSLIVSYGLPASVAFQSVGIGVNCRKGITYEATGTPVMTIVFDS